MPTCVVERALVRVVEMVPVRVVEMVPVLVVEIVPALVVEMVPVLVVEMVPGFANVVTDRAVTNKAAQKIDLRFFIALLLVIRKSGVLGSAWSSLLRLSSGRLITNNGFALSFYKLCAKTNEIRLSTLN